MRLHTVTSILWLVRSRQENVRQKVREATAKQTRGPLPGQPSAGPLLLTHLSSGLSRGGSRPSPKKAVPLGAIPARPADNPSSGMPNQYQGGW